MEEVGQLEEDHRGEDHQKEADQKMEEDPEEDQMEDQMDQMEDLMEDQEEDHRREDRQPGRLDRRAGEEDVDLREDHWRKMEDDVQKRADWTAEVPEVNFD
jgi:hypothetical protein